MTVPAAKTTTTKKKKQTNPNSLANLASSPKWTPGPNGTAVQAQKKSVEAKKKKAQQRKTMAQIANIINKAAIKNKDTQQAVRDLGLEDEDLTNCSVVVAGLYDAAIHGNLGAIEKWEELTGKGAEESGEHTDDRPFLLPAKLLARSFVDLNRQININDNFEYIIEGGRGSTKSSYISLKIIEMMKQDPGLSAVVIRKVKSNLRESVFEQLRWAINVLGLEDEWKANVSPMQLKNVKTDQRILFRGLDDPTKLKSIKPPAGQRIGILWVEEASELYGSEELRSVEQSTLRGGDAAVFLSYNPPKTKNAWVNIYANEMLASKEAKALVHHSTYLDVPEEWLGKAFIEKAEHLKATQPQSYECEYLGIANGDGGSVFENLEIREITDEEVSHFDRIYQGLDFGWYPDPTAFVRVHYDRMRERVYIFDELVVNKWSNRQTADELKKRGYNDTHISCDSEDPKSIADLRAEGLPARKAIKGPGSVSYGMKWLAGRTIIIDPKRTPRVYKEFSGYEFERDKEGNIVDGYPDKDNHTIDAVRYALEPVSNKNYNPA